MIIYLSFVFVLQKDPMMINEIRQDLREGASKYGEVKKIVICDVSIQPEKLILITSKCLNHALASCIFNLRFIYPTSVQPETFLCITSNI